MNTGTVNITEIINNIVQYMRIMYLDYLVEHEELYHDVFFCGLKELLPLILLIIVVISIFFVNFFSSPNYENIDTYVEMQEKAIRKALKSFLVIGAVTACLGYIFIPFTQGIITRAYDKTVEICEQMEEQALNYIDTSKIAQNDIEDIKESLAKQLENINNCSNGLQDVMVLAIILYGAIALLGLISILHLIIAVEIYIYTYINKRYKKFKFVL